jgi:chromate reductase, NAD(P)H dehydrogenase (quinone)
MTKILIITASEVKNFELAQKFQEQLNALGQDAGILKLVELNLPLYSSINDPRFDAKDLLGHWYTEIHQAQGFIFLAPEYNGGLPPVFTNFLAWVSRTSKEWRECFNGKTAGIATFSGGGGQHALMAMRLQLSYIGINVLGRQIIAHAAKPADERSIEAVCRDLIKHSAL